MNEVNKILDLLNDLIDDCESQYNSLNENNDINWDCYDKSNWESMTQNLLKIKELIKKGK